MLTLRRLCATVAVSMACLTGYCCTSAAVSASRSATGSPLLWKHRDTGVANNFIARHHTQGEHEYIALYNCGDSNLNEAWAGVNSDGFAIINTASYNLAPDTAAYKDREGYVMASALGCCSTVDDFEQLLARMDAPRGIQANFGVVDTLGNIAYFEACDTGYTRYDYPDSLAVRTNYSHSGGPRNRYGLEREKTAVTALTSRRLIEPALFTDTLSRMPWDNKRNRPFNSATTPQLHDNGDYIPRSISTASIVIQAAGNRRSTMHVILGYPPCGITRVVTFDDIPPQVAPDTDGIAPDQRRADDLKRLIYVKPKTIDLKQLQLCNGSGQ